jgi:tRNA threonylcarbamoyladenosine biosynthesis protein TsaE
MKMSLERVIDDKAELKALATEFLNFANGRRVIAFFGEMGSGKTTFIRVVCEALGVKENVSSPTFSLINEYTDNESNPVFHFDFYRIEKEAEAVNIGCEEYFESGSLCLIEWPEKILNLLPERIVEVSILSEGKHRKITISHD